MAHQISKTWAALALALALLACKPASAQAPFAMPGGSLQGQPVTGIAASSGTVAAGAATATLPAVQGRFTYICGFAITSSGSTTAIVVAPTVVGAIGGTQTYAYATVAGVLLANAPLVVPFTPCLPSSAVNTAIVVSIPSLGAGNTNTTVSAWGYQ